MHHDPFLTIGDFVPTWQEPVPGWIDNMYGPISIIYGATIGVLRVLFADIKTNCCIIPVDFCANTMIACAWQMAKEKAKKTIPLSPPIYHLAPDARNMICWEQYKYSIEVHGSKMPLAQMVWFPFLLTTSNKFVYNILSFIYHTVPGYLMDLYLFLTGKKMRMSRLYRKIRRDTLLLEYFVSKNFTFSMENTRNLWKSLSTNDQDLFRFDVLSIDWPKYFYDSVCGMRRYLAKEEPDTIPKGMNIYKRLYFLHKALQCLVCGGGLTLLFWTSKKIF